MTVNAKGKGKFASTTDSQLLNDDESTEKLTAVWAKRQRKRKRCRIFVNHRWESHTDNIEFIRNEYGRHGGRRKRQLLIVRSRHASQITDVRVVLVDSTPIVFALRHGEVESKIGPLFQDANVVEVGRPVDGSLSYDQVVARRSKDVASGERNVGRSDAAIDRRRLVIEELPVPGDAEIDVKNGVETARQIELGPVVAMTDNANGEIHWRVRLDRRGRLPLQFQSLRLI